MGVVCRFCCRCHRPRGGRRHDGHCRSRHRPSYQAPMASGLQVASGGGPMRVGVASANAPGSAGAGALLKQRPLRATGIKERAQVQAPLRIAPTAEATAGIPTGIQRPRRPMRDWCQYTSAAQDARAAWALPKQPPSTQGESTAGRLRIQKRKASADRRLLFTWLRIRMAVAIATRGLGWCCIPMCTMRLGV